MFSYSHNKLSFLLRLTILLKHDYILTPVKAMNGVIWSKNAGDFVAIFSIKLFAELDKQRLLLSREIETHNFKGKTFRFSAFPINKLIEFSSNDTVVTGVHGDTWRLISSMLNFKLDCKRVDESVYGTRREDGSWNGLIGYLYRNETDIIPRVVVSPDRCAAMDFTSSPWLATYRFFMKESPQYNTTWITKLFNRNLWFYVIVIFFVLTITSFTIHVSNYKDKKTRNSGVPKFGDHFFYILSTFCNQDCTSPPLDNPSKVLMLSTRFFCWLLIIAFSSKLIANITKYKFQSPIENVDSFYKDTDYTLLVKHRSITEAAFRKSKNPVKQAIIKAGRLLPVGPNEVNEKICTAGYVYLEAQDVFEAQESKLCELRSVGNPYFVTWIAGGLIRGFKYKKTLNLGMLKLHEFGIADRIKSKWLTNTNEKIQDSNKFTPIRPEHVSLIFTMLCSAAFLSLVILLIENLYNLKFKAKQ